MAVWKESKTNKKTIIKACREYYAEKLAGLKGKSISLPMWKECIALAGLNRDYADRLCVLDDDVRIWRNRINDLNEIVVQKLMAHSKIHPMSGVFFLKAAHGWREEDRMDPINITQHITNISAMLQAPSPTRVNPFADPVISGTAKATLTTATAGQERVKDV